jgi:hypothetical protein
MSVKEFFKEWKPKNIKGMDKDDRTYLLYENIPSIVEFYIKKGHKAQNEVKELFDRMVDIKFAKTLIRILKTPDSSPVDYGMATVIAQFLEQRRQELEDQEELVDIYKDAIDKILKKRVKKISKKVDIDKDLIKELLVVVPEPEAISDPRFVGIYVSRVLRKLYVIAKENETGLEDFKTLKKLFKEIFGKDMLNQVAVSVLLERKSTIQHFNEKQKAMWNLVTNFALAVLEKNEKKELKELIEYYVMRRAKDAEKQRDSARRIQFAQISEEDYPKLQKVAAKLSKENEFKPFL